MLSDCHHCPNKLLDVGVLRCRIDHVPAVHHAAVGQCPQSRFTDRDPNCRPMPPRLLRLNVVTAEPVVAQRARMCQQCPSRIAVPEDAPSCGVDGVDVAEHAEKDQCPLGFYSPSHIVIGRSGIPRPIADTNAASPLVIGQREAMCRQCPKVELDGPGHILRCRECGCSLPSKIRDRSKSCPLGVWGPAADDRWFSHTGQIGDIIYALPAIAAAGGGALYAHHDVSIAERHHFTRVKFNSLRPLVESQGYISRFEHVEQWPTGTHRLDTFRDILFNRQDLIKIHFTALGLEAPAKIEPWLKAEPRRVGPYLMHRSFRYHNPDGDAIWEQMLGRYRKEAIFVGSPSEHARFVDRFGPIKYHHTPDLLELARVIAGADWFFGNQSAPMAVATGLGKMTILEVDPSLPNCCFERPHAIHLWGPRSTLDVPQRKVVQVYHDFDLANHPDRARVENAHFTWNWLASHDRNWQILPFVPRRSSKDIGDVRQIPYLRDLFDAAVAAADHPDDIVLFVNRDCCFVPEAALEIRRKLDRSPCCFSRRIEVDSARQVLTLRDFHCRPRHNGTDLFAFRAGWWKDARKLVPDMFIACEAYDFVLRQVMKWDYPLAELDPPVIYHERHDPFWMDGRNIRDNPAQKHNRSLARTWCLNNRLEASLTTRGEANLLKDDPPMPEW